MNWHTLPALHRDVCQAIVDIDEPTRQDCRRWLEQRSERDVSARTLQGVLDDLADRSLIRARTRHRDTTVYQLTVRGEALLSGQAHAFSTLLDTLREGESP